MATSTIPNKINNQILDEIGDYLNGNVSCKEINLKRFDYWTLLFLYRYGRIHPKEVKRIRHELRQELKQRKTH